MKTVVRENQPTHEFKGSEPAAGIKYQQKVGKD